MRTGQVQREENLVPTGRIQSCNLPACHTEIGSCVPGGVHTNAMKISLPCRVAVGPARVIGAAFAAVMLTALAQPVAAGPLSAQDNAPYEGHDLEITFTNGAPQNYHLRYRYRTVNGSATGGGQDYESTSGYVGWSPMAVNANESVIVETVQDLLCEHDETVRIILTDPQWSTTDPQSSTHFLGWGGFFCPNNRGLPCRFEAVATIKQHENGCAAGTFGE